MLNFSQLLEVRLQGLSLVLVQVGCCHCGFDAVAFNNFCGGVLYIIHSFLHDSNSALLDHNLCSFPWTDIETIIMIIMLGSAQILRKLLSL